jgi:hypothetical protein
MPSKVVQISYSDDMDHLLILRDKIGRLRQEIADIQALDTESRDVTGAAGLRDHLRPQCESPSALRWPDL